MSSVNFTSPPDQISDRQGAESLNGISKRHNLIVRLPEPRYTLHDAACGLTTGHERRSTSEERPVYKMHCKCNAFLLFQSFEKNPNIDGKSLVLFDVVV